MATPQNLVFFLLFLGPLVTVHELGHLLAAKWAGVKVLKFSIGWGPKMFGVRKGDTEYVISWLPLGGFALMLGQYPGEEVEPEDVKRSLFAAPWWKRAIISFAGPAFSLLFPIVALFFVFLGDHQVITPRVGWVEPGYPAAMAGIRPGDIIVSVDGKPIVRFEDIRKSLDGSFDRDVPIGIKRDGVESVVRLTPKNHVETGPIEKVKRGLLGISAVPRPAIIGVRTGSAAEVAGLRTFDRLLKVNDVVIKDEVHLAQVMTTMKGSLQLQVIRSDLKTVGANTLAVPQLLTVTMERQDGEGFAALGAESADLYVWNVFAKSPAEKAGIKRGDRVVSVDGVPAGSWFSASSAIQATDGKPFALSWVSGTEEKTAQLALENIEELDELKNKVPSLELGIRPRPASQGANEVLAAGPVAETMTVHYGPLDALWASAAEIPEAMRLILLVFRKMATRELSMENVGGPLMVAQVAAKSAEAGVDVFLRNMAMVSVNLGLVNLLPIPIFDGFSILSALWEGIRRRPISMRAREYVQYVGVAIVFCLFVLAFKNDITRVFFR